MLLYRNDKFALADEEAKLRVGDEVVILTHSKNLRELEKRFLPKPSAGDAADFAAE